MRNLRSVNTKWKSHPYLIHEAQIHKKIQQRVYKKEAPPRNKTMQFQINPYLFRIFHLFWSEGAVHISKTKTSRSVTTKSINLIISGHYQRLIAEVPKGAGQSDLGSELSVQQAEDGPATQVHADINGDIQD